MTTNTRRGYAIVDVTTWIVWDDAPVAIVSNPAQAVLSLELANGDLLCVDFVLMM